MKQSYSLSGMKAKTENHAVILLKCTSNQYLTFAAWTLNKEVNEIKKCYISVMFVWLYPVIHYRLKENK